MADVGFKLVFSFLISAAVILIFAPNAFGAVLLDDSANLYSDEQEQMIISMLNDASDKTGWNYGIVTLNADYNTEQSARSRAEAIYDNAFGESSSGVLFMCDVGYRYFVVAGDAEKYVSGTRFNKMVSRIKDLYFSYDDMGCAKEFINSTVECYNSGKIKITDNIDGSMALTSLYIGLVAAGIGCCFVIHAYKTYPKSDATAYIDNKKTNIYGRKDIFIRQFTTVSSNSSNSGGRGGGRGGHHGGGGFGGHR